MIIIFIGSGLKAVREGGASRMLRGLLRLLGAPRPSRYLSSRSEEQFSLLGPRAQTLYRDALEKAVATEKCAESQ
jgi:hypothetical protein